MEVKQDIIHTVLSTETQHTMFNFWVAEATCDILSSSNYSGELAQYQSGAKKKLPLLFQWAKWKHLKLLLSLSNFHSMSRNPPINRCLVVYRSLA